MKSTKHRQFWVVRNPRSLWEDAGSVSISALLPSGVRATFQEGIPFPPETIARVHSLSNGAYWDFWEMMGGWIAICPVVERLQDELLEAVQIFTMQSSSSSLEEDYRVVNFTHSADCLDYARSDYVAHGSDPKEMCSIRRLALCEDCLPPFSVFRPVGAKHYLLVDDVGRAALMRAGVTADYFDADTCTVVPGPRSPIPQPEPEPEQRALDPAKVVSNSVEHIDAILEILRKFQVPQDVWREVLAYCKSVAPDARWSAFSRPSLARDITEATNWLRTQLDKLPSGGGLYLGLDTLNMADGAGKNVEIGISPTANGQSDSMEWGDLKYGRDFLIKGLVKMHKIYSSEEWAECSRFCGYILFLAYSGIVLANACRSVFTDSPILVVWGFHDGDVFKLGRIELEGFHPIFE